MPVTIVGMARPDQANVVSCHDVTPVSDVHVSRHWLEVYQVWTC